MRDLGRLQAALLDMAAAHSAGEPGACDEAVALIVEATYEAEAGAAPRGAVPPLAQPDACCSASSQKGSVYVSVRPYLTP